MIDSRPPSPSHQTILFRSPTTFSSHLLSSSSPPSFPSPAQSSHQQREDVYIDGLSWQLTEKTQLELAKTVRQASLNKAITKAVNYISALYPEEDDETLRRKLRCLEINAGASGSDFSAPGAAAYGSAAPRGAMRMMKSSAAYGEGEDALNFEPEDVSISDHVDCRFAFESQSKV